MHTSATFCNFARGSHIECALSPVDASVLHPLTRLQPHRKALELAQNDIGELVEAIKASQLDANE